MHYQFDLFDKIIYDLSSPFTIQKEDLNSYKEFFKSKSDNFYNVVVASFKRRGRAITFSNRKKICSLHPEIERINKQQLSLFQNNISEAFDVKSLKSLEIKVDEIISFAFEKGSSNTKVFFKIKSSCDNLRINEARYYYYNSILKEEVTNIKKSITNHVFLLKSSLEIEHYIHIQQQALINISFKLTKLFNPSSFNNVYKPAEEFNDDDILSLTYTYLEDLLRFFETSFLKYIDQNIQIPYRSTLVKKYGIKEKLEIVKSALLKSQIDIELLNIIYKPFLELSVIAFPERITYKELIYSNTFLTAFYDELEQDKSKFTLASIIDILYQYNYNSTELFNFKTNKIKEQLTLYTETSAKIDYLYHCLKIANQRQSKLHIAYNSDLTSLKLQLINWLEEEISYLNKKASLSSVKLDLFQNELDPSPKIMSGLSVSQLAHFYKLLFEVGAITNENQSDIIRFLADNFQTAKTKNISIDSLKSKFYYTDESTIEPLRDYVIKILNKLKE
jgi:hypothetical protein